MVAGDRDRLRDRDLDALRAAPDASSSAREDGFQLTLAQQLPRFIAVVVCQYAVTTLAVTLLPGPEYVVFFAVAACVTVASFLLLRTKLFH